MASKGTSYPHPSLQQLLGDGGDTERSVTWELVILPRDDGCCTVLGYRQIRPAPTGKPEAPEVDGSAMSVQVLCSVGYGAARRGNRPFPL